MKAFNKYTRKHYTKGRFLKGRAIEVVPGTLLEVPDESTSKTPRRDLSIIIPKPRKKECI